MHDRNVLITGGTSGIGKATAHQLAHLGASLLIVGRNPGKGEAAVAEINAGCGRQAARFLEADLSLTREVRSTADLVRHTLDHLDVLIHSAGAFPTRRVLTDEGHEMSFAVQYLARFHLTNELSSLLETAPHPQVLVVAGGGSGPNRVNLEDLNSDRGYSLFRAIAKSSSLTNMLTVEQIARYPGVTFYNYGPGLVRTDVSMPNALMRLGLNTVGRPFSRSPEQAAGDIVKLLTHDYPGGLYGRSLKQNQPSGMAADAAARARLWEHSAQLVQSP